MAGDCDALAIPFFLVGAFARDLLLELHHGFKAQRATNDVGFGIKVERWEEFEALKRALVGTGEPKPLYFSHPPYRNRVFVKLSRENVLSRF